jgi:hypothetical protein
MFKKTLIIPTKRGLLSCLETNLPCTFNVNNMNKFNVYYWSHVHLYIKCSAAVEVNLSRLLDVQVMDAPSFFNQW